MKTDILGVTINIDSKDEIISQIKNKLSNNESVFIVTPYSEMLVRAQQDEEFRQILNSADFALPDGIGVLWAAYHVSRITYHVSRVRRILRLLISLLAIVFYPKYIHSPIREKISGSDFVWDLAQLAAEKNYSVFLLGGFGDTPEKVGERLQEHFPKLRIAGISNWSPLPYPSQQGEGGDDDIVQRINSSSADFLFVALGPGRQEKWIYENRQHLQPKLVIGLGGTFDYIAGKRPLAPKIWRNLGLEWLWRLFTQPWRIWRILRGVFGLIWYTIKSVGN